MKVLAQATVLALVGAGLSVALSDAALPRAGAQPVGDPRGVQAMKNEATGLVSVTGESATRRVGFIRVEGRAADLMPSAGGDSRAAALEKTDAYLDKYAANFGARPGELQRDSVARDRQGWTVTYTQAYRGIDVFGSMLRAQVDEDGDLTSVNGYAAPGLSLSTTPSVSAADAAAAAVATVKGDPPGHDGDADTSGVAAGATDLVVYRLGATKGETGDEILAWAVEVTNHANVRDMVFLDAASGKLVNRYSLVHDALDRELYEGAFAPGRLRWREGQRFPGRLDVDQQNEVLGTGEAYWFFRNAFGRDSYDGAGHTMVTVNNDPRISCPNANWNGVTTNYCSGVSPDDVVAHEWGHAYTEHTHGLIYQWQPGALNEAYSDIWGETVDLVNGRMDQDEGAIDAKRPAGLCSTHSPGRTVVTINAPQAIAKTCDSAAASFGPALSAQGITADVVPALDAADATGPTTDDACTAITNPAAVAGHVALVKRGACTFTTKVRNAQDAGATAVLVQDNVEVAPGGLGGADPSITIPSVRIRLSDGDLIRSAIAAGDTVNVTMRDGAGERVDSYRWLMGEDAPAFNGAIRDMWSPTCYGDPGKVSDAEYHCAADDGGGVHSNSGVPNHGYALLVDGGTYNGETVTGIGLDKAAAIYFRAMAVYQTPTTDFTDHADALAASCTDLVGQPIHRLSTAPNRREPLQQRITGEDCRQVDTMTEAVELRTDPVQCAFEPLLDPDTPALCSEGGTETQVWSEDFEDGLAGWTASQQVVFAGGFGMPWEASTSAPGAHPGGVAFAPAPDEGDCSGGAGDFSSRSSITSPGIRLPAGDDSPRLAFDHYVATEAGYDGGNVKVSVNGGPFTLVPASAYTFNSPGTLNDASTSTSPLAGQDGFSGTDGGEVTGSWGTSQVDLAAAGVSPGDTLVLRFDVGRDGCGGLDGWYVDDVEVVTCVGGGAAPAREEGNRA